MGDAQQIRGAIEEAAALVDSSAVAFALALQRPGVLRDRPYVETTLASLGALGYLQCQAMVALVRSNERFGVQLAQLLRSLIEAWSAAAWITAPSDDQERLQRALGYERHSLGQADAKLLYQREHGLGELDPTVEASLVSRRRDLEAKAAQSGAQTYPRPQHRMESLGRYDRYLTWRSESAPVHGSSAALGQLIDRDADGVALLGGPSNPGKVLIRLATAWEVADDLFRTSLAILSIDDEQFLRQADDIERSFRQPNAACNARVSDPSR